LAIPRQHDKKQGMQNEEELLEQFKEKIDLPVKKQNFRVFVFGPALSPSDEVSAPLNPPCGDGLSMHAKYLRYLTAKKLRDEGWTVDFGETESIQKFWRSLGIPSHAAMEVHHASKLCGAIVIFPTSVGSISELALFTGMPWIAKKTLAIIHSEFKEHKSFFRLGLLRLLKIQHGQFEFEDYSSAEKCADLAVEFVEDQWTGVSLDKLYIDDAKILNLEQKGGSYGS